MYTRFTYMYERTSAAGAAEAVPANNDPSLPLVWRLRSGALDAIGEYPKAEVYDALLLLSSVTFNYELAYWHTTRRVWIVFRTGTITADVPLAIPFPYENAEIYFRRTSVTGAPAVISCQPKHLNPGEATLDGLLFDEDGYLMVVDKSYDAATDSLKVLPVTDLAARRIDIPVALVSTPKALTASWAYISDGGAAYWIDTRGYTRISLFAKIDINDSVNVQFRMVASHTNGGSLYNVPILKPDTSATPYLVRMEAEVIEYNVDADGNLVMTWDLSNTLPFVGFQVYCAVPGASAGTVDCSYTLGWGS